MNEIVKSRLHRSSPFIGRRSILIEKLDTLEDDWHVEFWRDYYYFLGAEMFSRKRQVVVLNSKKRRKPRNVS